MRFLRPRHVAVLGVLVASIGLVGAFTVVKPSSSADASTSGLGQAPGGAGGVGQDALGMPACGTPMPGMMMEPCGSSAPAPSRVTAPPTPSGKVPFAQYQEIHADCGVTARLRDDPIVYPGVAGASHNHTFAGNTTTNASSTNASLAAGRTACEDKGDKSAYWFPTLLQNGKPVDPSTVTVYYKSGVKDYRTVQPFPVGFRLIVGSVLTPDAAHFAGNYQCTGYQGNDFPASCPAGSALIVHLKAPSCWDGVNLDTPDHKSHMAWPVKDACPADHPVPLPMLEIKVAYKVPATSGLAYSSGPSWTFHYDFMNGWIHSRLADLVAHCINGGRQCNGLGADPHKP